MITEETFQSDLDADPTNHGLRLVFADWLEEQGDERARFYRWAGLNHISPVKNYGAENWPGLRWDWFWEWNEKTCRDSPRIMTACLPLSRGRLRSYGLMRPFQTRMAAEEALAKVFAAHPKLFPNRGRKSRPRRRPEPYLIGEAS